MAVGAWSLGGRTSILGDPEMEMNTQGKLEILYLVNTALLFIHEEDSAYEREG
jgi:hypothetical protein